MIPLGKIRIVALVAVASAGLLGGHSLTYLGLEHSDSGRNALLATSGHGYLDRPMLLAGSLALISVLFWLAHGALRSRPARPTRTGTALVLALVQTVGFGAQEVLERLMAGAALHDLGSVLLLGLPLQLLVAVVAALLVTALHRAGEKIANLLRGVGPVRLGSAALTIPSPVHFSSLLPAGGLRTRGPPSI